MCAGVVAGFFAGTEVSNIKVNNSVVKIKGNDAYVGGVCGSLYGSSKSGVYSNLENIFVDDITLSANGGGWKYRGGIVGYGNDYYSAINNSYVNEITFMEDAAQENSDFAGSLVGFANGSILECCYYNDTPSVGCDNLHSSTNLSKVVDGKLETPVTIGDVTYDTLVGAMNAWVEKEGGDLIKWDCDALGVSHDIEAKYIDNTYHRLACKNCSYSVDENHDITLQNEKEATCTAQGYTGDEVCSICKEVIKKGSVIEKTAHNYVDGKCSVCGEVDPNYNQGSQNTSGINTPATGDSSNMTMWVVILAVCVVVIGGSIVYMKKNK